MFEVTKGDEHRDLKGQSAIGIKWLSIFFEM